jgi:hypothetical protein
MTFPNDTHRTAAEQQPPPRSTIWIFHGSGARHASGVFETLDDGLAWVSEHHLTGILAEYAFGGTYDVAVREGRFRPSRPHHGRAEHVAAFFPRAPAHPCGGRTTTPVDICSRCNTTWCTRQTCWRLTGQLVERPAETAAAWWLRHPQVQTIPLCTELLSQLGVTSRSALRDAVTVTLT